MTRETKIKLGVFSLAESAGTATVITLVDILVCPKRLEEQGYLLRDRVVPFIDPDIIKSENAIGATFRV